MLARVDAAAYRSVLAWSCKQGVADVRLSVSCDPTAGLHGVLNTEHDGSVTGSQTHSLKQHSRRRLYTGHRHASVT